MCGGDFGDWGWYSLYPPQFAGPTEEPVPAEMLDAISLDLRVSYQRSEIYEFSRKLARDWDRATGTVPHMVQVGEVPDKLTTEDIMRVCNKLTACYWTSKTQNKPLDSDPHERLVLAAIFKSWMRYHNDDPETEHDHFFANPIAITPRGPTTPSGIAVAHISICKDASSLLSHEALGRDTGFYNVLPLYRALIVIIDDVIPFRKLPRYSELYPFEMPLRKPKFIHLDDASEMQSVLLVRTGDESNLSTPISFKGLKRIPDTVQKEEPVDSIRVSLATAFEFITNLQHREEMAKTYDLDNWVMVSKSTTADERADTKMSEARRLGIDGVLSAGYAIRNIKMMESGMEDTREYCMDYLHRRAIDYSGTWI